MDNAKRKVYIDRHIDLGAFTDTRDELIEGFLASSPVWEETDAGDECLGFRFTVNEDAEAGPALNSDCKFRFTVRIRRQGDNLNVGKLALHSDFFKTEDAYYVLEVDESAQYSKYLKVWDHDYVKTKSFFYCVLDNMPVEHMSTYTFGKAIGVALADIINAEPEREVSE